MTEVETIKGKFVERRYKLKNKHNLKILSFREAMTTMKKEQTQFLTKFENKKIAVGVWTTPKRTKNPPWNRVYPLLLHDGIKICIIPAYHNTSSFTEKIRIQPATFSWFHAIGKIYIIIGKYIRAETTKKRKDAKNTKSGKKSTAGKTVLTFNNSHYDLEDLEKQIRQIVKGKKNSEEWNLDQIKKIPKLFEESIKEIERLCQENDVESSDWSKVVEKIQTWKKDHDIFLDYFDKEAIKAQNREFKSVHKLENVPGKKGKIDIEVKHFPVLHLTADSMKIDKKNKKIELLEGKNAKRKWNGETMVHEQHSKLIVFFNSDFKKDNNEYEIELVSYLTSSIEDTKKATETEIRKKYADFITDYENNEIKFEVDGKIIVELDSITKN
ncbi:MAG: hypothetical protein CL763_08680 [Chloroflexi bacterium]|nr:hypothetical protein [Chloroflexota bacterium]|tara:strand:+ start:185 stop:1336 length:1152 start_codon:yes stop_codon:yes gene_type:complete